MFKTANIVIKENHEWVVTRQLQQFTHTFVRDFILSMTGWINHRGLGVKCLTDDIQCDSFTTENCDLTHFYAGYKVLGHKFNCNKAVTPIGITFTSN